MTRHTITRLPLAFLACCLALVLSGCVSMGGGEISKVQRFMDASLPRTFTGDLNMTHGNPYLDVSFAAGGIRYTSAGWTWDWVYWWRRGRVSGGVLILGPVPDHVKRPTSF